MSTLIAMTANVAEAEAQLLAAQQQADKARRKAAAQEAARIRARIIILRPVLEELAVTVRVWTNRRLDFHYKVLDARAQVADWTKPPSDLFASDKEKADRKRQAALWLKRLEELAASYSDAAEHEGEARHQAMALDAEFKTLSYQFGNHLTIAEGGEPGFPSVNGGIGPVDENFLSIPGSLPDYPAVVVKPAGARRILEDGSEPKDTRSVWERL